MPTSTRRCARSSSGGHAGPIARTRQLPPSSVSHIENARAGRAAPRPTTSPAASTSSYPLSRSTTRSRSLPGPLCSTPTSATVAVKPASAKTAAGQRTQRREGPSRRPPSPARRRPRATTADRPRTPRPAARRAAGPPRASRRGQTVAPPVTGAMVEIDEPEVTDRVGEADAGPDGDVGTSGEVAAAGGARGGGSSSGCCRARTSPGRADQPAETAARGDRECHGGDQGDEQDGYRDGGAGRRRPPPHRRRPPPRRARHRAPPRCRTCVATRRGRGRNLVRRP